MRPVQVVAWALLLLLVATMPVFAIIRARGRPPDADVARRGASVLLGLWLRDWMIWVLTPLERAAIRSGISPDTLNYLGVGLGLIAGLAFMVRQLSLAAWLIALGGTCDILDGRIARARATASPYGDFVDAILDRFAETFIFVGVAWYLSGPAWMTAATLLALAGSLLVSYTRAKGEALGVASPGGIAQRADRLVFLAVASLLEATVPRPFGWPRGTFLSAAVVSIAVASVATAIYRAIVIARALTSRESVPGRSVRAADVREERGTAGAAPR
jgi:phosphatidylglycerophosphate synthase